MHSKKDCFAIHHITPHDDIILPFLFSAKMKKTPWVGSRCSSLKKHSLTFAAMTITRGIVNNCRTEIYIEIHTPPCYDVTRKQNTKPSFSIAGFEYIKGLETTK